MVKSDLKLLIAMINVGSGLSQTNFFNYFVVYDIGCRYKTLMIFHDNTFDLAFLRALFQYDCFIFFSFIYLGLEYYVYSCFTWDIDILWLLPQVSLAGIFQYITCWLT